jgi:hypothetical protein
VLHVAWPRHLRRRLHDHDTCAIPLDLFACFSHCAVPSSPTCSQNCGVQKNNYQREKAEKVLSWDTKAPVETEAEAEAVKVETGATRRAAECPEWALLPLPLPFCSRLLVTVRSCGMDMLLCRRHGSGQLDSKKRIAQGEEAHNELLGVICPALSAASSTAFFL